MEETRGRTQTRGPSSYVKGSRAIFGDLDLIREDRKIDREAVVRILEG